MKKILLSMLLSFSILNAGFFTKSFDLNDAVVDNDLALVKQLIQDGWDDINIKTHARTPLFQAVQEGNIEIVRVLINANADLNIADSDGWTPLYNSINNKTHEISKLLIEKGADLNIASNNGRTPLRNSIILKTNEISKLLIEKGADFNIKNDDGKSSLELVLFNSYYYNIELVKLFLEKGANLNIVDEDGDSPLIYTLFFTKYKNYDLAKLMIEKGVRFDSNSEKNKKRLYTAIKRDDVPLVKLLISAGIKKDIKNLKPHNFKSIQMKQLFKKELISLKDAKIKNNKKSKSKIVNFRNKETVDSIGLSVLKDYISSFEKNKTNVAMWYISSDQNEVEKYFKFKNDEFEIDSILENSYSDFIKKIQNQKTFIGKTSELRLGIKFKKYDFKNKRFPLELMTEDSSIAFEGSKITNLKLSFNNINKNNIFLPMQKAKAKIFIKNRREASGYINRELIARYTYVIQKVTPKSLKRILKYSKVRNFYWRVQHTIDVSVIGYINKLEILDKNNKILYTYITAEKKDIISTQSGADITKKIKISNDEVQSKTVQKNVSSWYMVDYSSKSCTKIGLSSIDSLKTDGYVVQHIGIGHYKISLNGNSGDIFDQKEMCKFYIKAKSMGY
ncbi:MAG: ankyrin repeat domain-containing protein [Campylobacterota bacterium]|nr:ankyrin repeat domain-containing protein [Campylobacterota bacterium]